MSLCPYLYFPGDCAQVITFYEAALNAEVLKKTTGADMIPETDTCSGSLPAPAPDAIIHAQLRIGGSEIMMSDGYGGISEPPAGFSLSLVPSNLEEGQRWFEALSAGGEISMEWQETFWAYGFGMLRDKFGISWMVSVNKPH